MSKKIRHKCAIILRLSKPFRWHLLVALYCSEVSYRYGTSAKDVSHFPSEHHRIQCAVAFFLRVHQSQPLGYLIHCPHPGVKMLPVGPLAIDTLRTVQAKPSQSSFQVVLGPGGGNVSRF